MSRFDAQIYDLLFEGVLVRLRGVGLRLAPPRPGLRVVDLACGTGSQLRLYQQAGCRVTGIDRSATMCAAAARKLAPFGHGAVVARAGAERAPFADRTFDLAILTLALHEMPPEVRPRVLSEARRVIAPDGGRLLLTDYFTGPPQGAGGRLFRGVLWAVEASAGGSHFRGFRHFMDAGGIPALARDAGFALEAERLWAGGNLHLCLYRPS